MQILAQNAFRHHLPDAIQKEPGLQTHNLEVNGTNVGQATSYPDCSLWFPSLSLQ
jgi:hypothetical protein